MNKERCTKFATWILLGIFAWFYCGNTLFLHSHIYQGRTIVHSHPYLPSDTHTHTSLALQSIAAFNAASTAMDIPAQAEMPRPDCRCIQVPVPQFEKGVTAHAGAYSWRAPPVV